MIGDLLKGMAIGAICGVIATGIAYSIVLGSIVNDCQELGGFRLYSKMYVCEVKNERD